MTPIRTAHCNFTYTAPAGMTSEQCGDLPCERDTPRGTIKSWWAPTPEQRLAIANGALIRLSCHSIHHPPISLDVHSQDPDFTQPTAQSLAPFQIESLQFAASEFANSINQSLDPVTPADITRIQADALRYAGLMVNDICRGTKSEDRAEAIDEARDLLLSEAHTLHPSKI